MNEKVFLGIDTSNYTTSISFVSYEGKLISNIKKLLPVTEGEVGLRQSNAVFEHIRNLSSLQEEILKNEKYDIKAIGYSSRPRDVEGSYMPCFLVGESFSLLLSSIMHVDRYSFSHQAGHVFSAIYSSGMDYSSPFISFHVSGGTTEILYVGIKEADVHITKIGGSIDLHAGQAIDRIGVQMGCRFPCGKYIEEYALQNDTVVTKAKICVNKFDCNLSGLENMALKLYSETNNIKLTSAFVIDFISDTIIELTKNVKREYGDINVLYAGGVMSNSIIKKKIRSTFENVYFAEPEFSSDNAVGIALLAREQYLSRNN